jgi:hypothetical protein
VREGEETPEGIKWAVERGMSSNELKGESSYEMKLSSPSSSSSYPNQVVLLAWPFVFIPVQP